MVEITLHSVLLVLGVGALTLFAKAFQLIWRYLIRPRWLLRDVRHIPARTAEKWDSPQATLIKNLEASLPNGHGTVVRSARWFLPPLLVTTDRSLLHEVSVTRHLEFPKPPANGPGAGARAGLSQGLLFSEGEQWHRQRKIMTPSFGPPQIKAMYPIFLDKAILVRDEIMNKLNEANSPEVTINIHDFAERVALDTISSAGFGYESNSISGDQSSPLLHAFGGAFAENERGAIMRLLRLHIPLFARVFPDNSELAKRTATSLVEFDRIGKQLVTERKEAAIGANTIGKEVDQSELAGRDLLSTLVRSNMSASVGQTQKMSDDEVQAQISTFFVAGRATTSSALSWAIYALSTAPHFQSQLRSELLSVPTSTPSYDELNALPFLDAVIHETLRVFSPVPGSIRLTKKDCVLPMNDEGWVDNKGKKHDRIFVPKGALIYLPIRLLNFDKEFWGANAREFDPTRWLSGPDGTKGGVPEGAREMPSMAMPTFLAGPRACIGFRFTLIEMKAVLFSLLRVAKFELAVDAEDVEGEIHALVRPRLKSKPQDGLQLPVRVSAVDV